MTTNVANKESNIETDIQTFISNADSDIVSEITDVTYGFPSVISFVASEMN